MSAVTAADIVAAARALLGTPFHHQGRVPGVGVDCAGVPICIARALGLVAPDWDVTAYPRVPDGVSLQRYCDDALLPATAPEPGGVVLVAWGASGLPQHLGVVVPYLHARALAMVHADSLRHGQVVLQRMVFGRVMRLVRTYRFAGVVY